MKEKVNVYICKYNKISEILTKIKSLDKVALSIVKREKIQTEQPALYFLWDTVRNEIENVLKEQICLLERTNKNRPLYHV